MYYEKDVKEKLDTLNETEQQEYEDCKKLYELVEEHNKEGNALIATIPCPNCGTYKTLLVNKNAYNAWRTGELSIKDAFPTMPREDRERLSSGICPECYKKLFGDEPDDEDE